MKRLFVEMALEDRVLVNEEQTHHILRVLRHNIHKPMIIVSSLTGAVASYEFQKMEGKESVWMRIGSIEKKGSAEPPIVIAQSFLKGEKLEWILQKATELNAESIFLVNTENCVVKIDAQKLDKKIERWNKILLEAAQQSGRTSIPKLYSATSISHFLEKLDTIYPNIHRLVAYENEEMRSIHHELSKEFINKGCLCMIGPEGGFTPAEIEKLEGANFISVSLGNTILRAETAAIYALSVMHFIRS